MIAHNSGDELVYRPVQEKEERCLRDAAMILRNHIVNVDGILPGPSVDTSLLTNKTADQLCPKQLKTFLSMIVNGSEDTNDKENHQILSIAQDIIHVTSTGRKKMPRHIALGAALQNMTGSKRIVQMLNKFGHCTSYETIERIRHP